ncbi:1-acyl-sn-glycerol-3-phosphate acyltransferase [Mycoplasma sp. Mirounga ES2805-ORL]|uniref:lysophospholipid acyltransferase family protein n=1 Tax=Mycoplasma sp. Mirounga ES2805-ORL TaxID=754514 RepID=UPI001F11E2CE|nr:lysophospholipid acyltransferase family protein [Mycoplasma sp. Mirounga ES2805-ORL]
MHRINSVARKYRKSQRPEEYPLILKNNYLLKNAKFLLWMFGIKVTTEGYNDMPKSPALLVPNHKSNLDAIALLVALEKKTKEEGILNKIPTFLAKQELKKKRLTRNALSMINTFYVDRKNIRQSLTTLNEFGDFVKQNRTYGVIFPEGTRILEDGLGEFKPGIFKVAISQYLPIVPVAISDTRKLINVFSFKKQHVNIKFLPSIKPGNILTMEPFAIADKCKLAISEALYGEENK